MGESACSIFQSLLLKKSLGAKKSAQISYSTENLCLINVLGQVPLQKHRFMPVLSQKGPSLKNVG
jgi:hypothetical protein